MYNDLKQQKLTYLHESRLVKCTSYFKGRVVQLTYTLHIYIYICYMYIYIRYMYIHIYKRIDRIDLG